MRPSTLTLGIAALAAFQVGAPHALAAAKPSAQAASCADSARRQGLTGSQRAEFERTCLKGPLASTRPTAPTAASKESQAVTKPSGVDRTTRTRQCADEADRKHLADKERKAFQLSCLATAGPVSEGETGTRQPHPAHQIKGIGVNNYKPDAKAAHSAPDHDPPPAAKPQR